ncbi:hypothetical protein V5098_25950 [Vibrio coralliirubri]|uniref:hypothetical protein n=1 Tax=Vibrio coralliirubri TaxID=1516159 RepID=UPI002FD49157
MSYDIIYEQLALRVPKEDVVQQACTFIKERLNHTDTQSTNELKQALYERYRLRMREVDLLMLHILLALVISLTRRQTNEHVAGSSVV